MQLFDYELTPTEGVFYFEDTDGKTVDFTVDFTVHEDGAEIQYIDFVQEDETMMVHMSGDYLTATRTIQAILDEYVLEDL